MQPKGKLSFYEILALPPSASREDIDKACVDLWYRYQSMRATPLWKDLSQHIEEIRSTLLNPKAKAAYDKLLVKTQSMSFPNPQDRAKPEHQSKSAASSYVQAEQAVDDSLPEERKPKFSRVIYVIGVAAALLFNKMIDWMSPENWSEIATIAWLVLFFCLATTCLLWAAFSLYRIEGPMVIEK